VAKIPVGGGFVIETFSVPPAALRKKYKAHRIIEPMFSPRPIREHRRVRTQSDHAARVSDTWSGGLTSPPAGQTIASVQGIWTVPTVALPAGADPGRVYAASTWVGIDGDDGSPDVLQAGCDADVRFSAGVPVPQYRIWYEWYPGNSSWIDNMPVAAEDRLSCVIQLVPGSNNSASIFLSNETRNIPQHFAITAPDGYSLIGNCAEWILEANGQLGPLAQYGQVSFTGCQAETTTGTMLTLAGGDTVNMLDADGQVISAGNILSPNDVQVSNA
jgi:hypothetical protein